MEGSDQEEKKSLGSPGPEEVRARSRTSSSSSSRSSSSTSISSSSDSDSEKPEPKQEKPDILNLASTSRSRSSSSSSSGSEKQEDAVRPPSAASSSHHSLPAKDEPETPTAEKLAQDNKDTSSEHSSSSVSVRTTEKPAVTSDTSRTSTPEPRKEKTPTPPPPKPPTPEPAAPARVVTPTKAPSVHSTSSDTTSSSDSSSDSDSESEKSVKPKSAIRKMDDDSKSQKKVQISDDPPERPMAASPRSARFTRPKKDNNLEQVTTEIVIVRKKPRSAPARSQRYMAESSDLVYLRKECDNLERKLKKTAKVALNKRPKIQPYTPFTWNSLAPYYNTDTLRYLLEMPVCVRKGYNSRATASGMVDPEVSWKMDHTLTPITPSRPELFRQHYARRRTRSAMPRLTTDRSPLKARFPPVQRSPSEQKSNGSRPTSMKSAKKG